MVVVGDAVGVDTLCADSEDEAAVVMAGEVAVWLALTYPSSRAVVCFLATAGPEVGRGATVQRVCAGCLTAESRFALEGSGSRVFVRMSEDVEGSGLSLFLRHQDRHPRVASDLEVVAPVAS